MSDTNGVKLSDALDLLARLKPDEIDAEIVRLEKESAAIQGTLSALRRLRKAIPEHTSGGVCMTADEIAGGKASAELRKPIVDLLRERKRLRPAEIAQHLGAETRDVAATLQKFDMTFLNTGMGCWGLRSGV